MVVTKEDVETHCANSGFIVANVRRLPRGMQVKCRNQIMREGDWGMEFWIADLVASELSNHYDDTPPIEFPFDEIDHEAERQFTEWVQNMVENGTCEVLDSPPNDDIPTWKFETPRDDE